MFIWSQISQSIINKLFDPNLGPQQLLPPWVKVGIGVLAMKRYSTLCRARGLEPHKRIQFSVNANFIFQEEEEEEEEEEYYISVGDTLSIF